MKSSLPASSGAPITWACGFCRSLVPLSLTWMERVGSERDACRSENEGRWFLLGCLHISISQVQYMIILNNLHCQAMLNVYWYDSYRRWTLINYWQYKPMGIINKLSIINIIIMITRFDPSSVGQYNKLLYYPT